MRCARLDEGGRILRDAVSERGVELQGAVDAVAVLRVIRAVVGLQEAAASIPGKVASHMAVVVLALERCGRLYGQIRDVSRHLLGGRGVVECPRGKAEIIDPPSVVVVDIELEEGEGDRVVQGPGEDGADGTTAPTEELDRRPLRQVQHHVRGRKLFAILNADHHAFRRLRAQQPQADDLRAKAHDGPAALGTMQHRFDEREVAGILPVVVDNHPHAMIPLRGVRVVDLGGQLQLPDDGRREGRVDAPSDVAKVLDDLLGREAVAAGFDNQVLLRALVPQRVDATAGAHGAFENADLAPRCCRAPSCVSTSRTGADDREVARRCGLDGLHGRSRERRRKRGMPPRRTHRRKHHRGARQRAKGAVKSGCEPAVPSDNDS
mmetsp:Transcript_36669/g.93434  ORF Transcript_36669/g.93434 Transcript_36669/m.93434 type:complete len:378 (+) Transcript_36669:634-1767(+)